MTKPNHSFTSEDINAQIKAMEAAAYQRGWDDAIEAVRTAASRVKSPVKIQIVEKRSKTSASNEVKEGSMIETVLNHIRANPGIARKELRNAMLEKGVTSSDESLKTSIRRLLKRKIVAEREGRLY